MSEQNLRDYFAVYLPPPDIEDIARVAGCGYRNGLVFTHETCRGMRWEDWWATMDYAEQALLSAKARYVLADAMLAVRRAARKDAAS